MELNIVHLAKSDTLLSQKLELVGGLVFETCLRQIVFLNSNDFLHTSDYKKLKKSMGTSLEVFKAETAYQFVLEVICGLRSLIKGETEIFGQFKKFFFENKVEIESLGMTDIFKQFLTDCKVLRSTRIQNWGHNTYGSITRKLLNSEDGVALLGGGQLAREIAPWLKHIKVKSILLRKQRPLEAQFSDFEVQMTQDLKYSDCITVLVVAANVTNCELQSYLVRWPNIRMVVDWRGDEWLLPSTTVAVFRLNDLQEATKRSKEEESVRIQLVIRDIQTKALEFEKKAKHNPWGWEDFCA